MAMSGSYLAHGPLVVVGWEAMNTFILTCPRSGYIWVVQKEPESVLGVTSLSLTSEEATCTCGYTLRAGDDFEMISQGFRRTLRIPEAAFILQQA